MSSTVFMILSAILFLLGAGLMLHLSREGGARQSTHNRFVAILNDENYVADAGRAGSGFVRAVGRVGDSALLTRLFGTDRSELRILLQRAGWYRREAPGLFYALQAALVLGLWGGSALYALAMPVPPAKLLLLGIGGLALGFLAPRYLLRWRAAQRVRRLEDEVPVLIHLLRMLLEAGLSVEQCLKMLQSELPDVLPELTRELNAVVRRISTGMDRTEALDEMAKLLDISSLTDVVAILKQVSRFGGSVRQSLIGLSGMIEERNRASLQERVGKLSGKMTIVMMIFLFPALLMFLMGPGLMALGQGLSGVGQ